MGIVKYLLDTHVLLWAVQKDVNLSSATRPIIEQTNIPIFVSAVSAYEIMNKYRLGKLPDYSYVAENYLTIIRQLGIEELPIKTNHAHYAGSFEWEHRDPFDRFLAAQAFIEDMVLITNDKIFDSIPWLTTLW